MNNSLQEISLYIHIPFCVSKCTYCDFFSIPTACQKNAVHQAYIDSLCKEILFRIKQYDIRKIKTVYIGGGTPSLLNSNQIKQISDVLKQVGFCEPYEFTFEVNPDDVSKELLQNLEQAGVNRISCGIQSFSQDVLKSVHRRADSEQNYSCFDDFQAFFNGKISADLICGLPGETEKSFLDGLGFLISKNIPHISMYSLCVEDETPLGYAINSGSQKYDFDFSDELWIKGRDLLLSKGYVQYEVSNFCLPGNECLHNMAYWTHKNYIGCGSGATGTVENLRYTNSKDIQNYTDFWNQNEILADKIPQTVEKISQQTAQFEYFMMGLRTLRGVSPQEYEMIFGEKIAPEILEKLKSNCKKSPQGFYYLDKEKLLFLNSFLEELM